MKYVCSIIHGSKLYGTNIEGSDTDIKSILVPDIRDIVLANDFGATHTKKENSDQEIFTLKKFIKLLSQGQTAALEMIFAPKENIISSTHIWQEILNIAPNALHVNSASAFIGYCRVQASKYVARADRINNLTNLINFLDSFINKDITLLNVMSYVDPQDNIAKIFKKCHVKVNDKDITHYEINNVKYPETAKLSYVLDGLTKKKDEYGQRSMAAASGQGIDWKSLMHALRISEEAKELLINHTITLPRPNAEFLKDVRNGKYSYDEVIQFIDKAIQDVEEAKDLSTLPAKPNNQILEDFVFTTYLDYIKQ